MSQLSFWGWGYEEKSPGEETLDYLASRIENYFDVNGLQAGTKPQLNKINLPEPSLSIPEQLSDISHQNPRVRALNTYGKGYPDLVRGFRGDFTEAPDFVSYPESEKDINKIFEWARKHSVALVPVGGTTSVVRGIEPLLDDTFQGLVAINMGKQNQVQDIDTTSRIARIEAGAKGPEIEQQLKAYGFTLRHYPQSFEFSSLGGWLATRAAGHFATVETRIDDLTVSCRLITPEGTMETSSVPSSGAGPEPKRLVLGSEGTFGIITEANMRVRPRPQFRAGGTIAFPDFNDGIEACRSLVQSGLNPENCRYVSEEEMELFELSDKPANLLFLGFESAAVPVDQEASRAFELIDDFGGSIRNQYSTTDSNSEGRTSQESWKQAFFEAPYLYNGLVQLGMIIDTFETCCQWSDFEELNQDILRETTQILTEICGDGIVTVRLTHLYPEGPAPYYTVLAPGHNEEPIKKWSEIKNHVSEIIRKHDATITHHHAVGRVHKSWYREETSDLFRNSIETVKSSVDPEGMMNPGILM